MIVSAFLLWRKKLYDARPVLWILMFAFPFPYIATTMGWLVAELGRQPWLIYGIQKTTEGTSPYVHTGNVAFTTMGFMGMYTVISILFLYLIAKELAKGPRPSLDYGGNKPADIEHPSEPVSH